jgi:hypothetical protein
MRIIRKIADELSVFTVTHDFEIPNLALFVREEELAKMLKPIFPTIDTVSICWKGESVVEFMIVAQQLALTNASIRETIENTSFSFQIPTSFTIGEIDYRRNDVVVEPREEHFTVKLTFSLMPREFWNGTIPEDFVEKRCKMENVDTLLKALYCDDIFNPKWVGPTTIQFEVVRNSDLGIYSEDDVYEWFKHNSLEDTVYEGTGDFWTVSNLEME